jgi:hypothetical protein
MRISAVLFGILFYTFNIGYLGYFVPACIVKTEFSIPAKAHLAFILQPKRCTLVLQPAL